ncbi:hypothetical protein Mapa_011384 [Marchantia paleacea]|nr:hypothetical protein Mapa_011384 [Marchantia paleacea]
MEKSLKVLVTSWIQVGLLLLSIAALSDMVAAAPLHIQFLAPHNAARQNITGAGIPDLTWDTMLVEYAQNYADTQASPENKCALQHSGGPYHENIYRSSLRSTPLDAVTAWVSEKKHYNYSTNSCATGKACIHYLKVIWKRTKWVGCGSATCPDGGTLTVCNYNPVGNYMGQKPY